jgi:uncharacterized repeat protein (TIGR01451 family)
LATVNRRQQPVREWVSVALGAALACVALVASAIAVSGEREGSPAAPPVVAAAAEPATGATPPAEADGITPMVPANFPPNVSQTTEVFQVEAGRDPAGVLERHLVPPQNLAAGDELRYAIRLTNDGQERITAGRVQVRTAVPAGARFLPGSAGGAGALVEYAVDGENFFPHVPDDEAGEAAPVEGDPGWPPAPDDANAPTLPEQGAAGAAGASSAAAENEVSADAAAVADGAAAEPVLTIRWTYQQPLDPGAVAEVYFHVRLL